MASEPELPDLTATIEACYRVEQSRREWLQGVLTALARLSGGLGMLGFTYTVDTNLRVSPELVVDDECLDSDRDALLQAALSQPQLFLTQVVMHMTYNVVVLVRS